MEIIIAPERPEYLTQISDVITQAFGRPNEAKLVEALRKKKEYVSDLSLVATLEGNVVGHILLFPLNIVGEKTTCTLCLAPVSVKPDYQRKGIGSQLTMKAIEAAKSRAYPSIIVIGHPDYYPRFGFKKASTFGIKEPFGAPDEAFMALELKPTSLSESKGTVLFPNEYLECG